MIKKASLVLASIGIATIGMAAPASADLNDYLSNPGRQQAAEVDAQCGTGAGSGGFGAFGKENNFAGGANGYQTGLNNSRICGNR